MDNTYKYAFWFSVIALLMSMYNQYRMNQAFCDIGAAFQIERRYTYPILRQIGDPDNEGKGFKNPFTTQEKYYKNCK